MTNELIDKFFQAYSNYEVSLSGQNSRWKYWKSETGEKDYQKLEEGLQIVLPDSYKQWHARYNFSKIDLPMLRIAESDPNLASLAQEYNADLPPILAENQMYVFGDEGNDVGPLVFDGRMAVPGNEFPIRVYDHEYVDGYPEGMGKVIFSNFTKMVECLICFLEESPKNGLGNAIRSFYDIDPEGAGNEGRDYWETWIAMLDYED